MKRKHIGRFAITQDGMTFEVLWGAKDFSVKSNINGIQLLECHHMMFMCPLTYTEKSVKKECKKMIPDFINAAKIITENKKFFDEKTEYLNELKIQHNKRIEEFHSKRKVLKEQFDNKAITQTDYQEQLGVLQNLKIEYSRKANSFMHNAAKEITVSNTRCMYLIFYYFNEIWRDRT